MRTLQLIFRPLYFRLSKGLFGLHFTDAHNRAIAVLVTTGALLGTAPLHADTQSDMHDALKERWYTTEIIVFRSTTPPGSESLLIEGKKMSAAEQAALGTQTVGAFSEREPSDVSTDNQDSPAINTLTLPTATDIEKDGQRDEQTQRPELDAQPWDTIRDYDGSDDLGELVARNMATWETQLRALDGQPIPEEALTLTEAVAKLGKSRNLEVLLHTGWTQAVPPRDQGRPIALTGLGLLNGNEEPTAMDDTLLPQWGLSGQITVTLGRYLHVQPTLFYTPEFTPGADVAESSQTAAVPGDAFQPLSGGPTSRATSSQRLPTVRDLSETSDRPSALDRLRDATANERYEPSSPTDALPARDDGQWDFPPYVRLDQTRRLRSGELHYIDHPELRLLVRITPVVANELLQEQFALLQ